MIKLAKSGSSIADLKSSLMQLLSKDDVYPQVLTALTIFLKENMAGQSVFTQYVEETKCPIDQSGPLPSIEGLDDISFANKECQDTLVHYYCRESESFYQRTQFLILFLMAEVGIDMMREQEHSEAHLWSARHAYIHNTILTSNTEETQEKVLTGFAEHIKAMRVKGEGLTGDLKKDHDETLAMLLVESSYAQIQFWKYEECEAHIAEA